MNESPHGTGPTTKPVDLDIGYLIKTTANIQDALSAITVELESLKRDGMVELTIDVPRQIGTGNIGGNPYFFPGLCEALPLSPTQRRGPDDDLNFFPGICDENEASRKIPRFFPGQCDEGPDEVPPLDVVCRDLWKTVCWLKLICWRLVHPR